MGAFGVSKHLALILCCRTMSVDDLLQYHVLTFGYQYNRNSPNKMVQPISV
jgi:hypothetical protein